MISLKRFFKFQGGLDACCRASMFEFTLDSVHAGIWRQQADITPNLGGVTTKSERVGYWILRRRKGGVPADQCTLHVEDDTMHLQVIPYLILFRTE